MILIVGGAGFIGSHVNKLLSERGYRTVVFDNLSTGHKEFVKWGVFEQGDLNNQEQIRKCFTNYPIKHVMHFSACAYVGESVINPAKYYRNNVINTLNLLDVMREFGVRYIVFSSTCAIYGIPKRIPIDENHDHRPINPYGKSKFMVEEILRDFDDAYQIKSISLRYFNAAGADPDAEIGELHVPETHIIPLAIHASLRITNCVKIFGTNYATEDGTCIRDYIHVIDLADAHIKAMQYLESNDKSESFNLGNERGYSVREVVDAVIRVSKRDFKVIESDRREGDPPLLIGSSRKAKEVLGWSPKYEDLDAIVETAWKWHLRKSEQKR